MENDWSTYTYAIWITKRLKQIDQCTRILYCSNSYHWSSYQWWRKEGSLSAHLCIQIGSLRVGSTVMNVRPVIPHKCFIQTFVSNVGRIGFTIQFSEIVAHKKVGKTNTILDIGFFRYSLCSIKKSVDDACLREENLVYFSYFLKPYFIIIII